MVPRTSKIDNFFFFDLIGIEIKIEMREKIGTRFKGGVAHVPSWELNASRGAQAYSSWGLPCLVVSFLLY
jgi:hypothetical protein